MKVVSSNNNKVKKIYFDNSDYFNYWFNKSQNIFKDESLSYYERIKTLEKCIKHMKVWKAK